MKRRHLIASALALPFVPGRASENFPAHPITLFVPWPAGGATDLTMRLLADIAGRQLGQKVIVENRGGAGGTLAMPVLTQAAPDGYTIAQMPQPVFRAPWTQKVMWDPVRDTTPIIQISGVTFGILVPVASPIRSVDDLINAVAAKPDEVTISTNGTGTTPHVVLDEIFGRRSMKYVHVPYKGTAEQMVALSAGQTAAGVNSSGFVPFVESGKLRLLATFGEHRSRRFPNVPTLKELGHGIVAMSPYGLAGPKGVPEKVVRQLHDAFRTAMNDPAHVAELAKYDQDLAYLGPEDYGRAMREALAAEKRTVERLGLARGS